MRSKPPNAYGQLIGRAVLGRPPKSDTLRSVWYRHMQQSGGVFWGCWRCLETGVLIVVRFLCWEWGMENGLKDLKLTICRDLMTELSDGGMRIEGNSRMRRGGEGLTLPLWRSDEMDNMLAPSLRIPSRDWDPSYGMKLGNGWTGRYYVGWAWKVPCLTLLWIYWSCCSVEMSFWVLREWK